MRARWGQGQPNRQRPTSRQGPFSRTNTAGQPQSTGALVHDAEEAVAEAWKLHGQVIKQQQDGLRRRRKQDQDVTEAVRLHIEKLAAERDSYEAQLAEDLRRVHDLELSSMDTSVTMREKKRHARSVAVQLRRLKEVKEAERPGDVDYAGFEDKSIRALRDANRQREQLSQELEDQIQAAHNQKELAETEIVNRRRAIAINESLFRTRIKHHVMLEQEQEDCEFGGDTAEVNQ
mmetsp:Transcript_119189/g.210634  ORF Transcript_119189/g.210634 Transcript_119189/m.210634 type:complete len:233 (-) Transcript_119189:28-726(-)